MVSCRASRCSASDRNPSERCLQRCCLWQGRCAFSARRVRSCDAEFRVQITLRNIILGTSGLQPPSNSFKACTCVRQGKIVQLSAARCQRSLRNGRAIKLITRLGYKFQFIVASALFPLPGQAGWFAPATVKSPTYSNLFLALYTGTGLTTLWLTQCRQLRQLRPIQAPL